MPDISKKEEKRIYDIAYRANHREEKKLQSVKDYSNRKKRFIENPAKYLWSVAKSRAQQHGIPFDIDIEDVVVPLRCPISNEILVKGEGYDPNSMSLDKLIPSKGYVKGNVFVLSRKWNHNKSNMTEEDLIKILNYIKERSPIARH